MIAVADGKEPFFEVKAYQGGVFIDAIYPPIRLPINRNEQKKFLNEMREVYAQEIADKHKIHRSKLTIIYYYSH